MFFVLVTENKLALQKTGNNINRQWREQHASAALVAPQHSSITLHTSRKQMDGGWEGGRWPEEVMS